MTKRQKTSSQPSLHPHPAASSRKRKRVVPLRRSPSNRSAAKSPLVLLHPFAACAQVWEPILPFLEEEHKVFALAIPGHRGAEPVPDDFDFSVEHAVNLLERQLDDLGIAQAHLVGNSLGGWLAIELARRGRATSVVAIAPGGGWELGSAHHKRLVRKFHVTRKLLTVGGPLASWLARSPLARGLCLRDAIARPERLTALQAQVFIESAWRCAIFDGVLRSLPTQPLAEPFEPSCPIRLVWGERDRLLPICGYSERWRRILPRADWVVLDGVGHVPMYDDPERVAHSITQVTCADPREDLERIAS